MLTNEDVQKLATVFATKQELKEAVENLATKADINNLMTAIDSYVKRADAYF